MKRSILLFTTIAGILYLSLSSYQNGASLAGHAKAKDGCSGAGCHGSASTAVTSTITIKEKVSGTTVSNNEYEAGKDYEITVTGMHATATRYGYMARITTLGGAMAGTLSNASTGSKIQSVSGGISVAEQSSGIAASGGMFTATFDWQAPTAGTGNVVIDLAVNATNGNNSADAGDVHNTTSLTLTEKNTSVGNVANNVMVNVFPNPVHNTLSLEFENNIAGDYQMSVLNIAGQVIDSRIITVNASSTVTINTTDWKAGMYNVVLFKDGAQQHFKVVKL